MADAPGGQKLASNKYFSPQELNNLTRVGQPRLQGMRKNSAAGRTKPTAVGQPSGGNTGRSLVVGRDLKKVEAPKTIQYNEGEQYSRIRAEFDGSNPWDAPTGTLQMNSSVTSFYSEKQAQIDEDGHAKIKKATTKPFDMMRRSTTNLNKTG